MSTVKRMTLDQLIVIDPETGRETTLAMHENRLRYAADLAAATTCTSCRAHAVINAICHACGTDQRASNHIVWE